MAKRSRVRISTINHFNAPFFSIEDIKDVKLLNVL